MANKHEAPDLLEEVDTCGDTELCSGAVQDEIDLVLRDVLPLIREVGVESERLLDLLCALLCQLESLRRRCTAGGRGAAEDVGSVVLLCERQLGLLAADSDDSLGSHGFGDCIDIDATLSIKLALGVSAVEPTGHAEKTDGTAAKDSDILVWSHVCYLAESLDSYGQGLKESTFFHGDVLAGSPESTRSSE